jgi:hypothetical protein
MAHDFGEDKLDDDAEFPLLVRVGATLNGMATALRLAISRIESWRKTKILYTLDGHTEIIDRFCHLATQALVKEFVVRDHVVHFHKFDPALDGAGYESMLLNEIGSEYASKNHHIDFFVIVKCIRC